MSLKFDDAVNTPTGSKVDPCTPGVGGGMVPSVLKVLPPSFVVRIATGSTILFRSSLIVQCQVSVRKPMIGTWETFRF